MSAESVKFLRSAAGYFQNRKTNGEDMAFWSNIYNAENCIAAATEIERLEQALRNIAEGNLGNDPWQANYDRIRIVAAQALIAPTTNPDGEADA